MLSSPNEKSHPVGGSDSKIVWLYACMDVGFGVVLGFQLVNLRHSWQFWQLHLGTLIAPVALGPCAKDTRPGAFKGLQAFSGFWPVARF
jgi:hypothetical protein